MRFLLAIILVLISFQRDDAAPVPKGNAEMLIGHWKAVKRDGKVIDDRLVIVEFTKDNKFNVEMELFNDKLKFSLKGTFLYDGKKVKLTYRREDKDVDETLNIDKLTANEFIWSDHEKISEEFLRVPEKK